MAREEFVQNFRNALSFMGPTTESVEPPNADRFSAVAVKGADVWLSTKTIGGFDISDFSDLPKSEIRKLRDAVDEFQQAAEEFDPDPQRNWRPNEFKRGWLLFCEIREIVGDALRAEWVQDVAALVQGAKQWCANRHWIAQVRTKPATDNFLGAFVVEQLYFQAEAKTMRIDPVARFAVGASGLVDLQVIPTYESAMITRVGGEWFIQGLPGKAARQKWSEKAFSAAVATLSELA